MKKLLIMIFLSIPLASIAGKHGAKRMGTRSY